MGLPDLSSSTTFSSSPSTACTRTEEDRVSSNSSTRLILERKVFGGGKRNGGTTGTTTTPAGDDNTVVVLVEKELILLFLGCEAKAPYGPYEHTATLFLDLICRSLEEVIMEIHSNHNIQYHVQIKVYRVSQGDFPPLEDYEKSHGVILPGSFNSAYDDEPWIQELTRVIQTELVPNKRKTLGVCFGHQIYAHSFPSTSGDDGKAAKCPAGPQAGRRASDVSLEGQQFLESDDLQLYYTHGDMVEKLPPEGIALAGTDFVPIQAAMYLPPGNNGSLRSSTTTSSSRSFNTTSRSSSTTFNSSMEAEEEYYNGQLQDDNNNNSSESGSSFMTSPDEPIAITFQAHPEYASSRELGLEKTLIRILRAMEERGDITEEDRLQAEQDALEQYEKVEQQSIQTMIKVGQLLGWFPKH